MILDFHASIYQYYHTDWTTHLCIEENGHLVEKWKKINTCYSLFIPFLHCNPLFGSRIYLPVLLLKSLYISQSRIHFIKLKHFTVNLSNKRPAKIYFCNYHISLDNSTFYMNAVFWLVDKRGIFFLPILSFFPLYPHRRGICPWEFRIAWYLPKQIPLLKENPLFK